MIFGMLILGLSLYLIGTTKINMIIGLALKGFACSFYYLPFFPVIQQKINREFQLNEVLVSDVSSSIFKTCCYIGSAVGPIYGSLITEFIGFYQASFIMAIFLLIYSFVYYCLIAKVPQVELKNILKFLFYFRLY